MRVLGIDYGEKRVGLALSDPTGTIATPLPTLRRRSGKRAPIHALAVVAREHGVEHLVLGLPLSLDGTENDWCREIRSVGERLAARTGLSADFVDERLTSVRAKRAIRESGLRRQQRRQKERVDAGAAQLILQRWLDARHE